MAEDNDNSANMITVVVRSPKESKDLVINGRDIVKQLKNACANEFSATVDQLCIIYSGKMLGDSEVLSDCGVYDGATVHLVIQSAHHVADEAASTEEFAIPGLAQSADVSATPFGLGPLGGLSGLSNLGLGSANFMDLQQKMMREMVGHPEVMRTLLNSPFVQQMMSSPDLMRQLMSTNPQLCEVMEKNPEIMQTMADPELMKRMIDVVKSPAMLQELMRGQEHLIGGIRIPSATAPSDEQGKKDAEDKEKEKAEAAAAAVESQQPVPESSQPMTVSELFGVEAVRSMLQQVAQNPQLMTHMLQAPYVQAMLQSMSTNPSLVLQMLYSSPVFAKCPELQHQLPATVPFFAQQLQNPEVQKLMTNPRALHAMLLIQQGMQELYAEVPSALGASMDSAGQSNTSSAYTQYLSQMLNMAANHDDSRSDEQKFALQLQQLSVMGFSNQAANIEALSATQGDLNSAINRLKAEN